MALSVEMAASLAEVPASDWDCLAPHDPMASHGWLWLAEEELGPGTDTRYVLVRQGQRLVGAVPCYLCYKDSRLMDPNQLMFGRFRYPAESLHFSFVPTMLIGPYRGYGPKLLLAAGLDEAARGQTMTALLSAVEDLARSHGLSVQIPKLSSEDSGILELVSRHGYHLTQDFPVSLLDIEWDDFDGYLGHIRSFSTKMRRNIKEEMNRFRQSDVRIVELLDPAAHRADLQKLAEDHFRRLNAVAFPYSDRFFVRLKEMLGDEVVFYGAFLDERLVGFVLMLTRGETAYLPVTGIDRDRTGNEATYFNLCYYRPIMDAIANGLGRLYFGATNHHPKARRGCKILELHHAYLGASNLKHKIMKPWFAFHSTWMKRRLIPLEDLTRLRRGRGA